MNTLSVDLPLCLDKALEQKKIFPDTRTNILYYLHLKDLQSWEQRSIEELIQGEAWDELNDRFYKTLKFGTGGLRSRTIGKIITSSEKGDPQPFNRPQYSAVGTNSMNERNVRRATQGFVEYIKKVFPNEAPRFVFAHDTRHFSENFARTCAEAVADMGGTAYLFDSFRSTPELSFAVRHLKTHAGVMITASHNPPYDNGYKAYFNDGAQIIEPHASGIINEIENLPSLIPNVPGGEIKTVTNEVDEAYLNAVSEIILDPELVKSQKANLKIVYTPIHGTGVRSVPKVLDRFGFHYLITSSQAEPNGNFPTVKSPNPENKEALTEAINLAIKEEAHLVIATDPDDDRMGIAVRKKNGEYELLNGNQIGSIIARYRTEKMFEKNILNDSNKSHAALIKTFVTTDLQNSIAEKFGLKCIETLTGFKYIGEKLRIYEDQAGGRHSQSTQQWRNTLLEKSTYFVFGGEESYGYLASDYVRDKDGNAATLMISEAASHASSKGQTLIDYLDDTYLKFGLFEEKTGTLTFEGAEGAMKIKKLLEGYRSNPPAVWGGNKVLSVQNFNEETYQDTDGKVIPKELLLIFHLEGKQRIAVRASGTEPKIKFYFFSQMDVRDPSKLSEDKKTIKERIEKIWADTQKDVEERVK
jgi:phosphoglucomutase